MVICIFSLGSSLYFVYTHRSLTPTFGGTLISAFPEEYQPIQLTELGKLRYDDLQSVFIYSVSEFAFSYIIKAYFQFENLPLSSPYGLKFEGKLFNFTPVSNVSFSFSLQEMHINFTRSFPFTEEDLATTFRYYLDIPAHDFGYNFTILFRAWTSFGPITSFYLQLFQFVLFY